MRKRLALALGVVLIVGAGGCAHNAQPCLIIPAQLDLAQSAVKSVSTDVSSKQGEVSRSQDNLNVTLGRVKQMEEQKADLEKAIAAGRADSAAVRRGK